MVSPHIDPPVFALYSASARLMAVSASVSLETSSSHSWTYSPSRCNPIHTFILFPSVSQLVGYNHVIKHGKNSQVRNATPIINVPTCVTPAGHEIRGLPLHRSPAKIC